MRQQQSFMPELRTRASERPMSEIVTELVDNTETLVRQEIELAMVELERKAKSVKNDVTEAAVGGAVLYAGLLAIVAAAVLLLAKAVDPWLSSLIVGVVVSVIGYGLMQKGARDMQREDLAPRKTVRSVQRSAHTLKEAVK